jgi:hypothetical protein
MKLLGVFFPFFYGADVSIFHFVLTILSHQVLALVIALYNVPNLEVLDSTESMRSISTVHKLSDGGAK